MGLVNFGLVRPATGGPVITVADTETASSVAISATGSPAFNWELYDPEGADASAVLSSVTGSSVTASISSWTGRLAGRWAVFCTDATGLTSEASFLVGINTMIYEEVSFGGTLNVSGSTVVSGPYTFDLNASGLGDLTSDADSVNMVVPANHNAPIRLSIPLSELGLDDATSFTFAFLLDPPTFPTSGASTTNFWQIQVGLSEADLNPYFLLALVFDNSAPSGKGLKLTQGTGTLYIKTNAFDIDTITGLAMRIYGGIPGESSPNGNRFARCFYTTEANPTLDESMTDWTEYGSGDLVGLRDVNDANINSLELDFRASNGSASSGYTVSFTKLMLLKDM